MCAGDGPETVEEMAVIERKREAARRQADIARLQHAALLVEDPAGAQRRLDPKERLAIAQACQRAALLLKDAA